jgi:hypothetical protein
VREADRHPGDASRAEPVDVLRELGWVDLLGRVHREAERHERHVERPGAADLLGMAPRVGESLVEVGHARDLGGAHALLHDPDRRERDPAVAELDRAADRALAVAADPDRGMRLLDRPRQLGVAGGREVAADQFDAVLAPGALDRADRLVGDVVARVEVGAERLELALQVARRDAEDQPPARQHVERGG